MPPRRSRPLENRTDAIAAAGPAHRPESLVDADADEDFEHMPRELRVQLAVAAVQQNLMSENEAARYYRARRTTVQRRLYGILTRTEAHSHRRKLNQQQEDVLAEWIKVRWLLITRCSPLHHISRAWENVGSLSVWVSSGNMHPRSMESRSG